MTWNFVEQDRGLRGVGVGSVAERLPHVHHGEPDARTFLFAKPLIKLRHAGFRAIVAAEPDGASANKVADHDPVFVAFADRDFVDADRHRRRCSRLRQLGAHVLLVQFLDGVPIQLQLFGDIADRCTAAAAADVKSKSLRVERVVRQEFQALAFHRAAMTAPDAPHLELQEYTQAAGCQIASAPNLAIVPAELLSSTCPARRFFERRTSVTTRACGSPNTPRRSSTGRKPGNRYASRNRRLVDVTRTSLPTQPSFARWNHF